MSVHTVLVVDDSPTERHYLAEILRQHGYAVLSANSGEEGLAIAKAQRPDLILMDVVMPGLNGFQATRMLSRDAETRSIPVIMCTTKDQETDRIWGLRQGAVEYMTKPILAEQLIAKIKAIGG